MTTAQIEALVQASGNDTENMNSIREALVAINSTTGGPLVYKALISQSGTSAPGEDDLDGSGPGSSLPFVDTIGGVWGYDSVGNYTYTKAGAFGDATKINVEFSANGRNQTPEVIITATVGDANTLIINSATVAYSGGIATDANSKLYLQPITIEVYP